MFNKLISNLHVASYETFLVRNVECDTLCPIVLQMVASYCTVLCHVASCCIVLEAISSMSHHSVIKSTLGIMNLMNHSLGVVTLRERTRTLLDKHSFTVS